MQQGFGWWDRGNRKKPKVSVTFFDFGQENIVELPHYRLQLLGDDDGDDSDVPNKAAEATKRVRRSSSGSSLTYAKAPTKLPQIVRKRASTMQICAVGRFPIYTLISGGSVRFGRFRFVDRG